MGKSISSMNGQIIIGSLKIPFNEDGINLSELHFQHDWQKDIVSVVEEWYSESNSIQVFSSGSTGAPSKFVFTKDQAKASAQLTANTFELKQNTIALLCLPAKYIAGKMMILRALIHGWDLICVEPSSFPLSKIKQKIDFAAMTPMQVQGILENDKTKFEWVEKLIIGGASLSGKLINDLQSLSVTAFETYGMTETLTHIATKEINGKNKSDCFSGLNGIELSQNEEGCLCIDAKHLNVAIATNDLVHIRDNKQFTLLGRKDNIINSGGVKIFPEKVEDKIRELIKTEFYISSEDDDALGQRVILMVEGEKPSDEQVDNLQLSMSHVLEKYENPKKIIFQNSFERTKSGKVIRN